MINTTEILPEVRLSGLHADGLHDSAFLKDHAAVRFRRTHAPAALEIQLACPDPGRAVPKDFGLRARFGGEAEGCFTWAGPGEFSLKLDALQETAGACSLSLELQGVAADNRKGGLYKWLAKLLPLPGLKDTWNRLRKDRLNRLIRVRRVLVDGEVLLDFKNPAQPVNPLFDLENRKMGINIMGWFRGMLGIGESARSSSRACDARGVPNQLLDLKTPCLADMSDDTLVERLGEGNPHGVNLIHINPPESHDLEHYYGRRFFQNRYNIGYWAWELPEFPDDWVPTWRYYHEIWCPSRFVADAVSRKVPLPVVVMPHAVQPEPEPRDWRAHFGLPEDRVLFLFAFDFNSYLARKNPMGVVEAFKRAFPGDADAGAGLVLKYHSADKYPEDLRRLEAALEGIPAVYRIGESLPRAAVTGLQSACDVFVSLHRSEGFGLNLAECMALGKPVIATDWSGSSEYIDTHNACPVEYKLVELTESHGPYEAGQCWAEPDLDHAAELMRKLAGDPGLRASLGARARATIADRFSPEAVGGLYRERLKWIQTWFENPEGAWSS